MNDQNSVGLQTKAIDYFLWVAKGPMEMQMEGSIKGKAVIQNKRMFIMRGGD